MEKPIIEVKNLSLLYPLGVIGAKTLQESVERWWYRMRGKEEMLKKIGSARRMIKPDDLQACPEPDALWALNDVSFTVHGESCRNNLQGKRELNRFLVLE